MSITERDRLVKREQPEGLSEERKRQARNQDEDWKYDEAAQEERRRAAERVEAGETPWREGAGIQAVMDAVRDVKFPTTRAELQERVGGREVHLSEDAAAPMEEVIRKVGGGDFESPGHFKRVLTQNWTAVESIERGGGAD